MCLHLCVSLPIHPCQTLPLPLSQFSQTFLAISITVNFKIFTQKPECSTPGPHPGNSERPSSVTQTWFRSLWQKKKSAFSSLSPSTLHLCPNPLIYHLLPEVVYFALCKCFPGFCAGTSLVFTLALPLPFTTLAQGHSEGRLGREEGGGGVTDLLGEAFSKSPVSTSPQQMTPMAPSPKPEMSLRRVWETTSPDSVPDPLCMLH